MQNARRRRGRPRLRLPIVRFQRLSLRDYPGKLCAKAIVPGCNFRCPYCDKTDIVLNHPETLTHLPDDVTLLNWEYAPGGERVARTAELTAAGFEVLVCPGTHGWQSHGTRLAMSMANVRELVREGRRRGAAGVLMTDWGDYGHRNPLGVSLHGMAHAAAHAWGSGVDEDRFTESFCRRALEFRSRARGDRPLVHLEFCLQKRWRRDIIA